MVSPFATLHMQASRTIASYWLPSLLVRFHQAYPLVAIDLAISNTQSVARAVIEGTTEIGFVEDGVNEAMLSSTPVGEDRFALVVAPGHPWADGAPVAPGSLLSGEWVVREQGSGTRSAFEVMLAAVGIDSTDLKVALTLPSNESVRAAVKAGPYITVMSSLVVAADIQAALLCEVNIALPPRSFYLLRHASRYKSRASLAFEQLIRQDHA